MLVTGAPHALVVGNTDGVGLALTRRLLDAGYRVTGVSRRESALTHARYEHAVLDASRADYREGLVALLARVGPCSLCVYCAGVGDLLDLDDLSREAHTVRVNLVGAVETSAVVIPAMVAARAGHFVALSSLGDGVSPDAPAYAASKAGLSSYLDGLALRLRPRGVYVTNVRLGFVDTKMAKSPVRPMMMSVERAVDIVMDCVARRPARRSAPAAMALAMFVLRCVTAVRLWLA